MASGEQQAKSGLEVHGELHSLDASLNVRVGLSQPVSHAPVTVSVSQYLSLVLAKIIDVVTGDGHLFFEIDQLASAEAIVAIADGGAGEDTVTLAGNRLLEFEAGRIFTIANSTANDGAYTSTGSSYDVVADQTTINVATASWTDTTVDGDITSAILIREGSTIARGSYAANSGELPIWNPEAMRRGRPGEGVYCGAPAGIVDVVCDGFLRKIIVKTGPTGNPIHDPTDC